MNILCVICHDVLLPSEDIVFSRCGHVFHFSCLSRWLERSKTCPQCREKVTENKIYRVYFTFPNSETASDNADNSLLQGRIDSLQFQILVKDKNIKYHLSKIATLEKQNAGLRQEVRKVESEINQKKSTIHALNEQIIYFKEKYEKYKVLAQELSQKEKELEQIHYMQNTFSKGSLEDIRRVIEKTKDAHQDALVTCISAMRKEFEERLELCKSENLSLQHRVNKLETILSRQNYIKSGNQRNLDKNSPNIIQKEDVYSKTNTKRKTENQNISSSPTIKTDAKMNQEGLSTTSKYSTIKKRAKLRSRPAQLLLQPAQAIATKVTQSETERSEHA
ncbi:E3 ubiquitin-protein ligase TRAIP isoform X2 [Camponotus floridanus]|uniref:E3 ubiquitin-protein ligase TRAIP isoform X2 n=1 Tax=Camponotus floridanus TaxID=104421 RepID=UPI00059DF49A|nr:E3 ubiquitin-protein ligase TRAIP isoform X2 [Camponotus floridanus]